MTSMIEANELATFSRHQLARVNLLPPEIEEQRRLRKIQTGLGGAVLGTLAVIVVLLLSASSSTSSAQADSERADATGAQLRAQTATYSSVTSVYARAAAARVLLTQAMGEEVRYSGLLNDLSLSVPENVWIKNLTFTQAPPADALGATPGVGTVTITGAGFSHDDVAVWLESLAGQKAYVDPYFSSSTEVLLGSRKVVEFTSTATLTGDAYSGAYTTPAGG